MKAVTMRHCPTHGWVQVSCYVRDDALQRGQQDLCPVPTYQEEPCGEELGPETKLAPLRDGASVLTIALQAKAGSLLAHVEEMLSPGGHPLDAEATLALLADPEITTWMDSLRDQSLLPVRRGE
jgi:hypothetical protein